MYYSSFQRRTCTSRVTRYLSYFLLPIPLILTLSLSLSRCFRTRCRNGLGSIYLVFAVSRIENKELTVKVFFVERGLEVLSDFEIQNERYYTWNRKVESGWFYTSQP